ncbi:hypothetical protein EE612_012558, partial [Oryza sativa]
HSNCLNVTHGNIFMGYRCKCLPGFMNAYCQTIAMGHVKIFLEVLHALVAPREKSLIQL